MKIAVLGLGVIGTTYAYAFQQADHDTFHIIREGRQVPSSLPIHLLDGRYAPKGEEKDGEYIVKPASEHDEYDFILFSFLLLFYFKYPSLVCKLLFTALDLALLFILFKLHLQSPLRSCADARLLHLFSCVPLSALGIIRRFALVYIYFPTETQFGVMSE